MAAVLTEKHLCDPCYGIEESERQKRYNLPATKPLPTDVEHITASEYLQAHQLAVLNAVDKPAAQYVDKELERFPRTRERLAFEMFELAWEILARGEAPMHEAGFAGCARRDITPERLPEYLKWLEKLIFRCCELRNQVPLPAPRHEQFVFLLSLLLISLRDVGADRYAATVDALKSQWRKADSDRLEDILSELEKAAMTRLNS
ncbi:MAG: hypothetical protein C5B50_03170 [Verrucomicrobia bacterium]|nr:MAG: hypothetical protein C5B50_03170 [Verrucomicrobiota bacterium]